MAQIWFKERDSEKEVGIKPERSARCAEIQITLKDGKAGCTAWMQKGILSAGIYGGIRTTSIHFTNK